MALIGRTHGHRDTCGARVALDWRVDARAGAWDLPSRAWVLLLASAGMAKTRSHAQTVWWCVRERQASVFDAVGCWNFILKRGTP